MQRLITCSVLTLTLALGAVSANATTLYRWVDDQGVVHYSDQPQPGAQKVQVQSAQTYAAPKTPKTATTSAGLANQNSKPTPPAGTYQCQVVSPTPEQAFFNPETVDVTVTVSPALVAGERIVLSVDGAEVPVSAGGQAQLPAPERGAHTINASVQAADGSAVCSTAPVTFNVQRPSLNSPQSPAHH